jgi:hypothetical protein
MSLENPVQRRGWARLAALGCLIFRLHTGKGWVPTGGKPYRRDDGSVVVPGGRPITLGFGLLNGDPVVGAGDLIGGTRIRVTQAMVGKDLLVFTSAEAKRTVGGRTSKDQVGWRDAIRAAGGIAGVFSSPEEAEEIVLRWAKEIGAELV